MLFKIKTPTVITFPHNKVDTPPTEADLATVRVGVEIHELCRDTSQALQELRHGIANVLSDTLETMSLDIWTLVYLLDEPSERRAHPSWTGIRRA